VGLGGRGGPLFGAYVCVNDDECLFVCVCFFLDAVSVSAVRGAALGLALPCFSNVSFYGRCYCAVLACCPQKEHHLRVCCHRARPPISGPLTLATLFAATLAQDGPWARGRSIQLVARRQLSRATACDAETGRIGGPDRRGGWEEIMIVLLTHGCDVCAHLCACVHVCVDARLTLWHHPCARDGGLGVLVKPVCVCMFVCGVSSFVAGLGPHMFLA
jgi:hypothetical protein